MRFSRVLIANRGEIARRVIRACRDLGLVSVAAYSDADADELFVHEADDAVRLGPAAPSESYLSIDAVLAAARAAEAEAIHPGYGFLSEQADFARAVTDAGLVFIGPSAEVIEAMGRKDRARELAIRAGVPVMPCFDSGDVPTEAFPVLVKAAAGGGGKGMHVVRRPEELDDALALAEREARAAFGDGDLLVERYLPSGRHIEVQVFGDLQGNVVHLYERDCSTQRRHQKIVEEAPAPNLDPALREQILQSAVRLCQEVGYAGAGTVEFLVADGQACFLEMNTRLQVEHPVTEEITSVDLVRWQLLVAAGEPLPLGQAEIGCFGHAMEARIYAEDPYAGFLPQAGRIESVVWPTWLARVEAAVDGSAVIGTGYDPMLAKIIVVDSDREGAADALVAALDDTAVFGLTTNTGFVRRLVDSEPFRAARVHAGWLDEADEAAGLLAAPPVPSEVLAEIAEQVIDDVDGTPFGHADGWRLAAPPQLARVTFLDRWNGIHRVEVSGHYGTGAVSSRLGDRFWIAHQGESWELRLPDPMARERRPSVIGSDVTAPMPGTILSIGVARGDVVDQGQPVAAIEAMKMELTLTAACRGVVAEVNASPGQRVRLGQLIIQLDPGDGSP